MPEEQVVDLRKSAEAALAHAADKIAETEDPADLSQWLSVVAHFTSVLTNLGE